MTIIETFDIIIQEQQGRLDKILSAASHLSRSQLQASFKKGLVTVNGQVVKSNYQVKTGDCVQVVIAVPEPLQLLAENIPLDIVYEDDALLVVNKASGMVVHPSKKHPTHTLVNALLYHSATLSEGTAPYRPGIVHRLDRDTSGLLVVAKTNAAHQNLAAQLADNKAHRIYYALVHGVIPHQEGTIDAPLARAPYDRLKWTVLQGGKRACTHFTVLERFEQHTYVQVRLETGRTHQIRVHFAYIQHPLVGDPIYGVQTDDTRVGQLLHAQTLAFSHPLTGEWMSFHAEPPHDITERLQLLRSQ